MTLNARLIVMLVFLLAAIFGSLHSASADPTLIQPPAAAFVDHAVAIFSQANSILNGWDAPELAEVNTFFDELTWRFLETDSISYTQLLRIYQAYAATIGARSNLSVSIDARLIPALVERWLAENRINLGAVSGIAFDGFEFQVNRLYVSLGGQIVPSFFLHMTAMPDQEYYPDLYRIGLLASGVHLIIIALEPGVYRVPVLPAPITGDIVDAGDFNADGQTDFAYVSYVHYGNSYAAGALQVVTWVDNELEPLTRVSFRHGPEEDTPVWQFGQFDDDPQRELLFSQRMGDNWGCTLTRLNYYDWNPDDALTSQPPIDALPQSFPCVLRRAEQAAWQHDFDAAIPLYEQALALEPEPSVLSVYAQMRLGLAYVLSGRTQDADAVFQALAVPADLADQLTWVESIRDAYLRDPRPLPVCQAVYDRFGDIYNYPVIAGTVYESDGGFYGPDSYDPGIDPPNLSCDFAALLDAQLPTVLPFGTPVLDQLQAMGLTGVDSITGDFDSDGDQDWLVWVASMGIDPILLRADTDYYTLIDLAAHAQNGARQYRGVLRLADDENEYTVITLPDRSVALASRAFGVDPYIDILCSGHCGGGLFATCAPSGDLTDYSPYMGDLTLWRLEGDEWVPFFSKPVCEWDQSIGRFATGSTGATLIAGGSFYAPEFPETVLYRPITYTWDAVSRTFLAPPQPNLTPFVSTPTPTRHPDSLPSYPLQYSTYQQVREAFAQRDYASTLTMINAALSSTEWRDPSLETAFLYYRALTLEALDRPEEALAQYVSIQDADPSSAWGLLAALHVRLPENG